MSKIIVNHNIKSTSSLEVVKDKKGILKDNIITYNHDGAMIKLKLLENKSLDEALTLLKERIPSDTALLISSSNAEIFVEPTAFSITSTSRVITKLPFPSISVK